MPKCHKYEQARGEEEEKKRNFGLSSYLHPSLSSKKVSRASLPPPLRKKERQFGKREREAKEKILRTEKRSPSTYGRKREKVVVEEEGEEEEASLWLETMCMAEKDTFLSLPLPSTPLPSITKLLLTEEALEGALQESAPLQNI